MSKTSYNTVVFPKINTKDNHPFSCMGSKLLKHGYLNEPVKDNQQEFYD